jgi:hypothetical protein
MYFVDGGASNQRWSSLTNWERHSLGQIGTRGIYGVICETVLTWLRNELASWRVLDWKWWYYSTIRTIWLHGGTCETTMAWVDNESASGRVLSWKWKTRESYQVAKQEHGNNPAMLMWVQSWKGDTPRVAIWLIVAMRLQSQHFFRLCTSSNTPSIQKKVIIGTSLLISNEGMWFLSCKFLS